MGKPTDYLENRFITEDDFEVGYYQGGKKLGWYMKLEKYGSDSNIFLNDIEKLEGLLGIAKDKIESLK